MLRDLQKDKGWYEKPTTCGYKFFDWRKEKKSDETNHAFFLHTALGIAVELKTDIFNWFPQLDTSIKQQYLLFITK